MKKKFVFLLLSSLTWQTLICQENSYSVININEFLSKISKQKNVKIEEKMLGNRYTKALRSTVLRKNLPGNESTIFGGINFHSIDNNTYYIWYEKLDSTDQKLKCKEIVTLHKENTNVFVKEIIPKDTSKEFIWGLYFYDKTTYLLADKQYKPQYLVIFSYEDESLNIVENTEYYILNSL